MILIVIDSLIRNHYLWRIKRKSVFLAIWVSTQVFRIVYFSTLMVTVSASMFLPPCIIIGITAACILAQSVWVEKMHTLTHTHILFIITVLYFVFNFLFYWLKITFYFKNLNMNKKHKMRRQSYYWFFTLRKIKTVLLILINEKLFFLLINHAVWALRVMSRRPLGRDEI